MNEIHLIKHLFNNNNFFRILNRNEPNSTDYIYHIQHKICLTYEHYLTAKFIHFR